MSGMDPGLLVILIGVLFLVGCLVIVRQFLSSDKSGGDNSKALQEALRDLSANQQQIVGSIKVITDTQTTSQAAIIKHVESRLEEIQNSISSSLYTLPRSSTLTKSTRSKMGFFTIFARLHVAG